MTIAAAAALATAQLRVIACRCATCKGTGETSELYQVRLMNDDERLTVHSISPKRRRQIEIHGPRPEDFPRAAAMLWTPCAACADIRLTIKMCEALL